MAYQENEVFAGRYKLIKKLGVGGFSEVWLADDSFTEDNQVAIKIYAPNGGLDNQGLKVFSKEYALLQDINNQYLLKAMHFDVYNDMPYLVLPYCPNGSLLSQLHDKGSFTEEELAKVIYEVCTGLAYLHDNGIIHQDIKPANILINRRNECVISDFGISNNVRRTLRKSMGVTASSMSPEYAPPERFSSNPKTLPQGDMFSFGVLLYELATGDVPWMGMGGMSLSRGAEIPTMPEGFSNNFKKWTVACLTINPLERPSADDFARAAHTFLTEGFWPPRVSNAQSPTPDSESTAKSQGRKTVARVDIDEMAAKIDASLGASGTGGSPKAGKSNATMRDGQARSQEPKKKRKSPLVAIVVGVVVVAAAAAGFVFYSKAQKEKQYQEAIANADKLLTDSNLVEAHAAYGQAMEILPTDTLAGKGQRATMKLMKALVKKSLKQAQGQFEKAEYDPALATLSALSAYEPKFTEIGELKDKCLAKKDELIEKEFAVNISKGDEYLGKLTYAKAAEYYGKADSLKPGDPRVQEKLNTIGSKLKDLFTDEITKGDAFMAAKNHSSAAGAYARAVLYDKNNADGKAKLAKAQEALEIDKKLLISANDNDLNDLKNLLAAGANPNYQSANQCPMGWAVYRGNLDAVKALKDAGADCNPKVSYYYNGATHYSLISLAGAVNNVDVFKFLHTSCKANVATVATAVSDGGIKDYLRSLGFGGAEFKEYFTSATSSKFPAQIDAHREWSFRDGKYYLRCITDEYAGWKGAEFDIDVNKDFEVTLEVHHLSGNTSNGGIGLLYASDEDFDYVNVFAVSPNGKYHTGYYLDGWKDVVYTESSAVNQGEATNKLKVVKKGSTVYFYINDKYITADYDVRMAGKLFGVLYGSPDGYTTVWYDNLFMRNL